MLKSDASAATHVSVSKIAHVSANFALSKLPSSAVLLDVFKTIETQLQNRHMLPHMSGPAQRFNPLWFSMETERNIYLWRRGCSLIQKDEFEFWVDPAKMITKRLAQLKSTDAENPFLNPLWSEGVLDPEMAKFESQYLHAMGEMLEKIIGHAHALSMIAIELEQTGSGQTQRESVLLPKNGDPKSSVA